MRSMTGYGYFFSKDEKYDIEVEVKSVNSKGLDLSISTDNTINHLDAFIRDKITATIKRGRVYVRVNICNKAEQDFDLNPAYLIKIIEIHKKAQQMTGIEEKINLQELLKFDSVLSSRVCKINDELFIRQLSDALHNCLTAYEIMTGNEGAKMKQCIISSIKLIKDAVARIESYIPEFKEEIRKKLTKSVKEFVGKSLGEDIDKKLMTEISFYVERHDVTEEIVRLRDHLEKLDALLDGNQQEIGRKLNFIFQELHREIQTTGAKLSGVKVFPSILLIKEEIEKCRELVQNVE